MAASRTSKPLDGALKVVAATTDRWSDLQEVLNPACQCQYWRMASSDYSRSPIEERQAALRSQLRTTPPPGLIAYLEGQPVGWIGVSPRERVERLRRSRTIPSVDDRPVWAVLCFNVRVGYRRQGIARQLLEALVEYARAGGIPALEAYPVDTDGRRIHAPAAYPGTRHMFEIAGFKVVSATEAKSDHLPRWVMRRELTGRRRTS